MRAIEKRLRARLRAKEAELLTLRTDLDDVRQDRNELREHFKQRFQWWIKLLGEKGQPNMAWLVEQDALWLRRFQWWPW
ncbi:MAG: hypothetical protein E8D44_13215 [Nitrospira sp.]|nr:MAG: hypothetical protein E8D44_13215 [Nitrospira sp.]